MWSYVSLKRRALLGVSAAIVLLSGLTAANGQQSTERYIPLGQSPGLSERDTDVGRIEAVDAQNRSVNLSGMPEGRGISVTDRTRIWLDRSGLKQTNTIGSFEDLEAGQKAEVKYEDPEDKTVADWIKVIPRSPQ